MCSHPGCKPAAATFTLKGPAGKPPLSGWALLDLPIDNQKVRTAWRTYRTPSSGPTDAVWQAEKFLAVNGITGVHEELESYAVDQWCRPEPYRCRGYDPDAPLKKHPDLPWAKDLWESANHALADGLEDGEAVDTLHTMVRTLTTKIEGPEGCIRCAGHWREYLQSSPPDVSTLAEARLWLWKAHNHTREGKVPVGYDEIAAKFNWT